jgi:CheY-like chemotaxis protein
MPLKGQLEDLPLLDMLQIIAFSKKSGYLRVAAPPGRGAIVINEGRVLFACSWSTMDALRTMARDPAAISQEHIKEHIEASVRELAGLREGSFNFDLTDEISEELGGVKITPFVLPQGLDPQELLLDLAVELDNERKETTTLLQLAFQGSELPPEQADDELDETSNEPSLDLGTGIDEVVDEPSRESEDSSPAEEAPRSPPLPPRPEGYTVVLVDDEEPVTDVVGQELERLGYRVFPASTPAEGARLATARLSLGDEVLVAADLKMPTSSGRSFYGGFELIRRLRNFDPGCSTVLMVESLSDKARARAKEMGIRRLAYKPTLTKPDPDLYRADLHEFAQTLHEQLMKLVGDRAEVPKGNGRTLPKSSAGRENVNFLAEMTKKLVEPRGSTDISRLVLQVAERFLERGVLFVVKGDRARGLAAFGLGSGEAESAKIVQQVSLDIAESKPISEVVRTSASVKLTDGLQGVEPLLETIGRGEAKEAVLIPLLYNRATLLLLYGDTASTGKAIGDLGGLELFMAQAGMALENKLLQRKLSTADAPLAENVSHGAES